MTQWILGVLKIINYLGYEQYDGRSTMTICQPKLSNSSGDIPTTSLKSLSTYQQTVGIKVSN